MTTKQNALSARLAKLYQAFCSVPYTELVGMQLQHLSTTEATLSFPMKPELVGNFLHGILHGGVTSSVLDMAGGMLVMAHAIEKHSELSEEKLVEIVGKTSTIDLQISYLRPGKGNEFIARAWMMKSGSKICFTRMELSNEDGELIATASGTYMAG